MIGYRNMLCGMHVHVAVPDIDTRINLIMRLTPYLPLLLALSTSSPFWQGHLTGLAGYRLAAYDELPRTGLPELFRTNEDYREFVAALTWAKIIPDASYIWWAVRPSLNNPTIELRVADSCTRLDDAIAIAALFRCLVRALDRDRALNAGFDRVGRAITQENKWHAQRYGISRNFCRAVFPVAAHGSWNGSIKCLISSPKISRRSNVRARSDIFTPSSRMAPAPTARSRSSARPAAAGRRRLTALKEVVDWAAAETQALGEHQTLNLNADPGFPLTPWPPIKRDSFTRTEPRRTGTQWQRRQSTSSMDPI